MLQENVEDVVDVVDVCLPPMSIYVTFLNTGKSWGYPQDLASALHVCLALPLDGTMEHSQFIRVFTVVYKVVHYLLIKHEEIAADRIPVLLQAYRRMLMFTAVRSDQRRRAAAPEIVDLTDCANRLSRLASIINTQRLRYPSLQPFPTFHFFISIFFRSKIEFLSIFFMFSRPRLM